MFDLSDKYHESAYGSTMKLIFNSTRLWKFEMGGTALVIPLIIFMFTQRPSQDPWATVGLHSPAFCNSQRCRATATL